MIAEKLNIFPKSNPIGRYLSGRAGNVIFVDFTAAGSLRKSSSATQTTASIRFARGNENLFSYVGQEPVNRIDPSGLYPDDPAYIPGQSESTLEYNQGLIQGAMAAIVASAAAVLGVEYAPALVNNRYIRIGEGKFPEPYSKRISIGNTPGKKVELGISPEGKIDFKIGNSRTTIKTGNGNRCPKEE